MSGLPPVPHDEWDGGSTPRPVQDSGKGKGQSSVISDGPKKSFEARSFESGSFKTPPSSWQHQSEGRMPSVEKGSGTRTEGPQPEIGEAAPSRPDLERALEEEMFMQLWKENKALKDELAACKKREHGETSSWSAISSTGQVGTPKRKSTDGGSFRYTPGGTQVPPCTPPMDEAQEVPQPPPLPPFPYAQVGEHYEHVPTTRWSDRSMELGQREWSPSGGGWGAGGEWTEWQLREAAKEINRRALRPDDSWRQDKPQNPPRVWERVFHPGTVVDSSVLRGEVCERARAGSASAVLGEVCEQARAGRASAVLGEVCGQDRACDASFAVHGEVCGHDRAHGASSAVLGGVYHRDGGQGGDRALHSVSYREAPLRHQQLDGRGLCDPRDERASCPRERGREKSPTEGLRSTNPVLPKLPQMGQRHSSVDASDWLVEVRPLVGDLSTMSSLWWDLTLKHVMKSYNQWISATPLERLRQKPPEPVEDASLNSLYTQRLEQRVTTMLLPCLPDELRKDIIATRSLWPAAILFRVLRAYQPGGHQERSLLLHELSAQKGCKDPSSALVALRLWKRQRSRADELGATLPDVLLQVRALDAICSPFLSRFPQTSFRVSTFRMETHLDERPTDVTLMEFHELLSAEMETLSTNSEAEIMEKPAAKFLQSNGSTTSPLKKPAAGDKACKFWGSDDGCRLGKQCRFVHGELEDKNRRCWLCSALSHRRSECPLNSQTASKKLEGGSGQADGAFPFQTQLQKLERVSQLEKVEMEMEKQRENPMGRSTTMLRKMTKVELKMGLINQK